MTLINTHAYIHVGRTIQQVYVLPEPIVEPLYLGSVILPAHSNGGSRGYADHVCVREISPTDLSLTLR